MSEVGLWSDIDISKAVSYIGSLGDWTLCNRVEGQVNTFSHNTVNSPDLSLASHHMSIIHHTHPRTRII